MQILDEYNDVFTGVGCLPGKHKIVLHENAIPVKAASRKIPSSLEDKLKNELLKMAKDSIIKKVTKLNDWVNPIVVVLKKDGSLKVCLDPCYPPPKKST